MLYKILLSSLLLPLSTHAMLTPMPCDVIIKNIAPSANRLVKNNLRLLNKECAASIITQRKLNADYAKACREKNEEEILMLRKKGALQLYEEIYNLFADKEYRLMSRLLLWSSNNGLVLKSAIIHSITRDDKPFIEYVFEEGKDGIKYGYHSEFDHIKDYITLATQLNRTAIIELLKDIQQWTAQNKISRGGGAGCLVPEW